MTNITRSQTSKSRNQRYPVLDLDAYSPEEVANRVLQVGVKKVRFPAIATFMLGLLGGSFISLGAIYQVIVLASPSISDSTAVIISPFLYSMGYIIAFISGAEIFTTNNLAVMSLASGKIRIIELVKNWSVVLVANIIGAIFIVLLFFFSGQSYLYEGKVADEVLFLSSEKLSYSVPQMFIQGLFGNMLICAGAWLAMAGRSVTDKFLALLFPLSAVPAIGFQHATGNMFYFFLSFLLIQDGQLEGLEASFGILTGLLSLAVVAIGNIIGGGLFIAMSYYFVYVYCKW
ncbi:formate/nitrite transporter family protein [Balneolales bacterium ANBcel1]|nr:formate/nitrite transporter family protein [Balneolales bacterium ANBcel1]